MFVYRPPNDTFTMRLFLRFVNQLKQPHDRLYIWSPILDPNFFQIEVINFNHLDQFGNKAYKIIEHNDKTYRKKILEEIKNDLVIIGIKDHLTSTNFNPWIDDIPSMAKSVGNLFEFFYDKNFIFFTSLENIQSYYNYPNVKTIPWGGDITNQIKEYKELDPITEKNMDSPYSFVCLNRGLRYPRAILISLLYGLELNSNGMISCMFREKIKDIFKETEWQFREDQLTIRHLVENGFNKFKKSPLLINDSEDIYGNSHNDNVSNFRNSLLSYYNKTFVELINETSYTEPAFNITEKTLNSIYASNFPIWISSKGTVKFLKEIGLDVFDDIIDHSYDQIENPIDRMYRALTDNERLLRDLDNTKQLWLDNRNRFLDNVDFAKNNLYSFYETRAELKFKEAISSLGLT